MTRTRRDGSPLRQPLEERSIWGGWEGFASISVDLLTELCAGIRVKRSLMT